MKSINLQCVFVFSDSDWPADGAASNQTGGNSSEVRHITSLFGELIVFHGEWSYTVWWCCLSVSGSTTDYLVPWKEPRLNSTWGPVPSSDWSIFNITERNKISLNKIKYKTYLHLSSSCFIAQLFRVKATFLNTDHIYLLNYCKYPYVNGASCRSHGQTCRGLIFKKSFHKKIFYCGQSKLKRACFEMILDVFVS